jgi:hypothetical protein
MFFAATIFFVLSATRDVEPVNHESLKESMQRIESLASSSDDDLLWQCSNEALLRREACENQWGQSRRARLYALHPFYNYEHWRYRCELLWLDFYVSQCRQFVPDYDVLLDE